VMINAQSEEPVVVEKVPLKAKKVYLKIDCDFTDRTDKAYFYYSLDGKKWTRIGDTLQMAYTLPHFMGYRFGLFNYATQSTGGYVDFDYYRVSDRITR
jgi:beta-xylosidase